MMNLALSESSWQSARRLGLGLSAVLFGLGCAYLLQLSHTGFSPQALARSPAYHKAILALLAIGLYASASAISRTELRRNAGVVIAAITVGVAVKALLAGGLMALAFGTASYLLLGVAVAQIDPLAVASLLRHSRMSERAQAILSAWASFDDPITVLLVLYLASFTLPAARAGLGGLAPATAASYVTQAGLNAALVAAAAIAWRLLRPRRPGRSERARARALIASLVVLLALSALFGLLLGIAVCGLFFRPAVEPFLSRAVDLSFYAVSVLLGSLLLGGADIEAGLLLGFIAFAAQILAGSAVSRSLPRRDRWYLALGQQNGITAIILALALAPYLHAAVGIIGVAILLVNTLHLASNAVLDRRLERPPAVPSPAGDPAAIRPSSGQLKLPSVPGEGRHVEAPAAR